MPLSLDRRARLLFAALFCPLIAGTALAENWPHWRGPTQNGISTEKGVPVEWSRTKNVAWKVKLPGPAGASPVVWGERVFLTSVDDDKLVLICISTAGKRLWQRTVGKGNRRVRGDEGNMASPSPTTDGKHVWAMFGNGAVGCYDFEGKEVWKINLQERFGRFSIAFGMSSSPVLWKDRLLLQLIHGKMRRGPELALVAALDKSTGKTVWRKRRLTKAYSENRHSYASPILYSTPKQDLFITHGADYTIAYDPKTGDEIWRLGGLNPQGDPEKRYHPTLRFVASPAAAEGLVVIPTAKRYPVFAIRADGKGDVTGNKAVHVWTYPNNTPDVPSPLIHGGLVYLCRENGNLMCLDAKTGKLLYERRTNRIRHRASPVYADGKIYLTGRDGKVTVVRAGRTFKILAQNVIGDDVSASPAISNGTIYLRSFGALWAIRDK
ncbi:MAG: PQQ-binding-like beta-propeller repeat protein [Planctomycetaceae bacterium]